MKPSLDKQTAEDLIEDLGLLARLCVRYRTMLPGNAALAGQTSHMLDTIRKRSLAAARRLDGNPTASAIKTAIHKKRALTDAIRTASVLIGATAGASVRQSPYYGSSHRNGPQERSIRVSLNDYRRDHHEYARAYEQAFLKAFVRTGFPIPPSAFLTSGGMAAITTIVMMLQAERLLDGPVLAGTSLYHETAELLKAVCGNRLTFADDGNPDTFRRAIGSVKPRAVFLDTLGNTERMEMPDLASVAKAMQMRSPRHAVCVLDNTSLGPICQPAHFFRPLGHTQLIVNESLIKLHEYGMDTVFAGIIWGYGRDTGKLFEYRKHLGTVLPVRDTLILPPPHGKDMLLRTRRIMRNTRILADILHQRMPKGTANIVTGVTYPLLPGHPSFQTANGYGYGGPFLMLRFPQSPRTVPRMHAFVRTVLERARREGVRIAAGTSFGFQDTRIYPTALGSSSTKPFLRIAPGTESYAEILTLGDLVAQCI